MIFGFAIAGAAVRLAVVLGAVGAICFAAIVLGMALALLRPPRMVGGRAFYYLRRLTPADVGLAYEQMNFSVRDHRTGKPLRIAGWWIPCPESADRCAVILHGYADSKIGGIAWAPLLQSLGFNVLAIDLRAHGQSQGAFSTAGFYERHDVAQVLDQVKVRQPGQCGHIILFGVSLGAAVAAATALLRSDLTAVVLDCPYVDFPSALLSQAAILPVPGRIFQRLALRLAQWIARINFGQIRPVDTIGRIPCPLWVIQSGDDPFVPPADQRQISAAVEARSGCGGIWRAPNSFHVLALADHPDEYRRRLGDFLAQAIAIKQVCS